jgi:tetratricopeptide (TPR) repeat protein
MKKRRLFFACLFTASFVLLTLILPSCHVDKAKFLYIKGVWYASKREYGKALESLDESIRIDPDFAEAYFQRGTVQNSLCLYYKAIEDYTKALELGYITTEVFYLRGGVFYEIGAYEYALMDFDIAIKYYPDNPVYYIARGRTYELLEYFDEAIEDYRRGCELGEREACHALRSITDRKLYQ